MKSYISPLVGLILFFAGNICAADDVLSEVGAQVEANAPAIFGHHPMRKGTLTATQIKFADQDTVIAFLASLRELDSDQLKAIGFDREIVAGSKYFALMFGVPAFRADKENISPDSIVRILRLSGKKVYWQGGQEEIEVVSLENTTLPMDAYTVASWGMGSGVGGVRPTLSNWAESRREHLPSYIKYSPFKKDAIPVAEVPKAEVCKVALKSDAKSRNRYWIFEFIMGLFK